MIELDKLNIGDIVVANERPAAYSGGHALVLGREYTIDRFVYTIAGDTNSGKIGLWVTEKSFWYDPICFDPQPARTARQLAEEGVRLRDEITRLVERRQEINRLLRAEGFHYDPSDRDHPWVRSVPVTVERLP